MTEEVSIALRNVSKVYKRYHRPVDRLKEVLLPGKSRAEEFWALRDINLEIPKGETIGIIGRNGSGKSTLLQIIAGTLQPTSGTVQVNGRVSALLELGSGFNPEFTGRQNVFFNGRILGLSQEEIQNRFDEIAAFADIGEFIDQPVKTYSSGMFVRLAFAVAVHVKPEVFIVDEALAVGDVVFQHKCMRRIKALMESGVTTLFVSHDSGAVKTLCNFAFMLNDGSIYTQGEPNSVFIEYMKLATQIELEEESNNQIQVENHHLSSNKLNASPENHDSPGNRDSSQLLNDSNFTRRGSGKARIKSLQLVNQKGESANFASTFEFDERISLIAIVEINSYLDNFILGFYICDKNGNEILGSNTQEENVSIGSLLPGDLLEISFSFKLPLRPGAYSLTVAGAEGYESITCDWVDDVIVFKVSPPSSGKRIHAMVDIPIDTYANVIALKEAQESSAL
jgi:lipopolysaccharide transport system ATP-binding protein